MTTGAGRTRRRRQGVPGAPPPPWRPASCRLPAAPATPKRAAATRLNPSADRTNPPVSASGTAARRGPHPWRRRTASRTGSLDQQIEPSRRPAPRHGPGAGRPPRRARGPRRGERRGGAWPSDAPRSRIRLGSADKTLHEAADHQIPAVHQHEEDQLEWQRDQHRRQHHHAHRHQDRGDHHVDD